MNINELKTIAKAEVKKEETKMKPEINTTKPAKKTMLTDITNQQCVLYLQIPKQKLCKRYFDSREQQIEWYKANVIKCLFTDRYVDRLGRQVTYLEADIR